MKVFFQGCVRPDLQAMPTQLYIERPDGHYLALAIYGNSIEIDELERKFAQVIAACRMSDEAVTIEADDEPRKYDA